MIALKICKKHATIYVYMNKDRVSYRYVLTVGGQR